MSPTFGLTYTVRYRLSGHTTWEFITAVDRLDARRKFLRLCPRGHIISVQEN